MQQLGLTVWGLRRARLDNTTTAVCHVTGPVEIHWIASSALVVPELPEVLLGFIPLGDLDLIVNPAKGKLEGAHGDEVLSMLKMSSAGSLQRRKSAQ